MSPPISREPSTTSLRLQTPTTLRHPTPDLQSLQGAYVQNVRNLEQSAEELSAGGSDIGEEIRKLNALSRQSSIQSSHQGDISVIPYRAVDRQSSTKSSGAESSRRSLVVDVNSAARWGGYSPNGFVTSPVGSISAHWSRASLKRRASSARYSRLGQVNKTMYDGRASDSPLSPNSAMDRQPSDSTQSRDTSRGSFARRYDDIASQIEESLQHVPPSSPERPALLPRDELDEHTTTDRRVTPPGRPESTDTYREAQLAFHDFDGVHFSPETDEFVELDQDGNEVRRVSARASSGRLSIEAAALLHTPRARPESHVPQHPPDGTVYYPAPVPKVLNLPKRLSRLPAAAVQSKRRSQMLEHLDSDARAAAPWLSPENVTLGDVRSSTTSHNRNSVASEAFPNPSNKHTSANLPPHVRAQMFFEHQPVRHDVELKNGSVVATLDSILEASATAPVTAFTDHPYVGDVRRSVYFTEHKTQKSAGSNAISSSPKSQRQSQARRRSVSAIFRRTLSSDETMTLNQTGHRDSSNLNPGYDRSSEQLKKSWSRLSLGDELERPQDENRTSLGLFSESHLPSEHGMPLEDTIDPELEAQRSLPQETSMVEDVQGQANPEEEAQGDMEENEGEVDFVKPSTLLAELQVRKAQQKSRGKTAATAFPNGMHSTLLQLDAVEEIARKKRKTQRIELAWEDPQQRALQPDVDKEDEDVPLGMLFPTKDGRQHRKVGDGKDFQRPLGLIEKRQLEEEEPLSNRRNRLRGGSPTRGKAPGPNQNGGTLPNTSPLIGVEAEPENETLAQRLKRMKSKDGEGASASNPTPKTGEMESSDFADEILGQFAGLGISSKPQEAPKDSTNQSSSPAPEVEETLGQRRARLQREREASGRQQTSSNNAPRPTLKSSGSLASLLTANPVGQRQSSKTYEPSQGTLLHANSEIEAKHRNQLHDTNLRASSYNLAKPLVDARLQNQTYASGLLARENSKPNTGGFAAGAYNNGSGGVVANPQPQPTSGMPMVGVNGRNGYFAAPTMPYAGYGYPQAMGHYPQMPVPMQWQQYANPATYMALTGGAMTSPPMMSNGFAGNAFNPGMTGGTYASYAQSLGDAGLGVSNAEDQPSSGQRAAIDRWRLGVAQR